LKHFAPITSILLSGLTSTVHSDGDRPRVRMETDKGDIVIELDKTLAPKTVENFLSYVNAGFYEGTIFHRVIKGFMIQGGGLNENMQQKPAGTPVPNEADNTLKNLRGTIAMARTQDPHSATSQFFINTVDNHFLDFKAKTASGWRYCVFGRVDEGMDAVDAIENLPTTSKGMYSDVPATAVVIRRTFVEAGNQGKK
jgi:cyclophilin family peptidyl-prolyl cis-trans isomerase